MYVHVLSTVHCLLVYSDGEDYNSITDVVRFEPGNLTSSVFLVPLVVDSFPEEDEQFSLQLARPSAQEFAGTMYNRIEIPRFPRAATILNGENKIAYSCDLYGVPFVQIFIKMLI